MPVLFQMGEFEREEYIGANDFYFEQAKKRILSQFSDIEGDADAFLKNLAENPPTGFYDHASFSEWALGESINFYELVHQLRDDIRLGLIAGMYHRWDKNFRQWIFHDLQFLWKGESLNNAIWKKSFKDLAGIFAPLEWNINSKDYSTTLEKMFLTVNVYKHGEGSSWQSLKLNFPELVSDPLVYPAKTLEKIEEGSPYYLQLSHQNLHVTDVHFVQFYEAIRKFWLDVPDKIEFQVGDWIPFPDWLEKAIAKQGS